MKLSTCLALTLVLGAGICSAPARAQDAAAAAASQAAPAPDAAAAAAATPKHRHHAHKAGGGRRGHEYYRQCLKEKLAVAQRYCDSHADASCQAEKDGAAKQCGSETRGEKQTG